MGREVRGVPEAAALTETSSVGAYLRTQRRLRGIGLAELEAVTRIPRRSLERLEAGEFDAHPDGFARGFVRAVAGALGLDPDDAVSRMLPEALPRSGPAPAPRPGRLAALAVVAAAAILAAALWLGRGGGEGEQPSPESEQVLRRDAVRELWDEVRRAR